MAARALNGKRHRSSGDYIDAVVNDVVRDADETPATGDETHRSKVGGIGWRQLVRSHLQQQEAIVRKIVIERPNDPVAIIWCVNEAPFFPSVNISFRVGIARNIQPVAAPAFTIARTGQETISELSDSRLAL